MSWAAYLRVSTDKQTAENQEPDVRAVVEAREAGGWEERRVYRESESAVKDRPIFNAMMEAARLGKIRRLYVWSLDRFGRSMFRNLADLRDLAARGVEVVSIKESWVEKTADPMLRQLLLAIFSWVAEHEHARLKDRTRAGLERARAQGKTLGRPKVNVPAAVIARALELRRSAYGRSSLGASWRHIARKLKHEGFGDFNHATLARACTKTVRDFPAARARKPGGS